MIEDLFIFIFYTAKHIQKTLCTPLAITQTVLQPYSLSLKIIFSHACLGFDTHRCNWVLNTVLCRRVGHLRAPKAAKLRKMISTLSAPSPDPRQSMTAQTRPKTFTKSRNLSGATLLATIFWHMVESYRGCRLK